MEADDVKLDRVTFNASAGPDELATADRAVRRLMDRILVSMTNQLGAGTRVKVSVTYEVIEDLPGSER